MKLKLTTTIFLAMLLGIVVGLLVRRFYPYQINNFADYIKILSDIFLRLIKMIIAPLVFSTLVVGIAHLGDFKTVGRIGIKTLIYFQFATILALVTGLILVNLTQPGANMNLTLPATGAETGIATEAFTLKSFVTHLVPKSAIEAMANNEILSLVVFSIFFGLATSAAGEQGKTMTRAIDSLAQVMLKLTSFVMQFAPVGVFGALAAVVALQGGKVLLNYAYLILCFFGGLLFFTVVILGIICFALKIPYLKLLKAIKEPMILGFSTASSEAAYPHTINALRKFGCPDKIITFVLPLGYSFNMDGSIMYMIFATGFIAQAYGMDLSLQTQITMILVLWVTSKGMAGVPRASLVVIAGTLSQFNIPVEGLLLLLGVDAILDMGRTATNVIGNAVATAVVSKWENQLVVN